MMYVCICVCWRRAWSDSEDEVGDDEYEPGFLPPQDWAGMYQEQKVDKKILAPEVGK